MHCSFYSWVVNWFAYKQITGHSIIKLKWRSGCRRYLLEEKRYSIDNNEHTDSVQCIYSFTWFLCVWCVSFICWNILVYISRFDFFIHNDYNGWPATQWQVFISIFESVALQMNELWHESDIRRKKSIHFSIQYKYVISICCNCFPSHFHINLISGFSFYSNSDSTFILNNFTLLFDSLFNKNIATLFINMKCKKLSKIFHSRMCLCRFYSRQ